MAWPMRRCVCLRITYYLYIIWMHTDINVFHVYNRHSSRIQGCCSTIKFRIFYWNYHNKTTFIFKGWEFSKFCMIISEVHLVTISSALTQRVDHLRRWRMTPICSIIFMLHIVFHVQHAIITVDSPKRIGLIASDPDTQCVPWKWNLCLSLYACHLHTCRKTTASI